MKLTHRNVQFKSTSATDIMNQLYRGSSNAQQRVVDPTVSACIKIIAETIGKLPAYLYQETETGDERIRAHKMLKVLTKKPNDFQTMQSFLEMVIYHLCTDGNFYGVITRSGNKIVSILPIEHPSCVTPKLQNGKLIYSLSVNPNMGIQGYKTEYPANEVLHIKMASGSLLKGMGCIEQARHAIDLSLVQREHSLQFASKASIPAGMIAIKDAENQSDEALDEIIDTLKKSFSTGSTATGELAVLEGDVSFIPVTISNADAQFLESRQFGLREICAIFRIPEHFLSGSANVKYSNYGQSMLSFYTETISPYIARIQAAFNDHLDDYGLCFGLDECELKRGDIAEQRTNVTELYTKGLITQNEARTMMNMNKVDNGDNFNIQTNNSMIGTLEEIMEFQRAGLNMPAEESQEETEQEEPENNNNNEGINNDSNTSTEEELPLQAE
ncbi:HK97 family phage portal protein [Aeromonas hydrophila]|uniref:phage portal protein n=1 Tax=Aeromonas hydrophila TaxID=644 RepID=UPI00216A8BC6|nr:phage portal protein [Aeromonas hydrophila]MCS3766164.1 HK97 family phage portal protein [Aeromonas hydrophila]